MTATAPVRVLLADDQPLIRSGIGMLLDAEADIEVVGQVDDGTSAVAAARSLRPDLVVMDVRMPDGDGVSATRLICADEFSRADDHPVRVLILTAFHVEGVVYAALRAGASGIVLKDAAPRELVSAIRFVADGEAWLDPAVAQQLIVEFAARPERNLPGPAELASLTGRERDVLTLMAGAHTNGEIAATLFLGVATVKTHVSRILLKLGLRDRAQAVTVAYETGFVRPGLLPHPPGAPWSPTDARRPL